MRCEIQLNSVQVSGVRFGVFQNDELMKDKLEKDVERYAHSEKQKNEISDEMICDAHDRVRLRYMAGRSVQRHLNTTYTRSLHYLFLLGRS